MQCNILDQTTGNGGSDKLNIFTQSTEPETKEGIWIKTADENYEYNNVEVKNNLSYSYYTILQDIPYEVSYLGAVTVKNEAYLFGMYNGTDHKDVYKYNPTTNTYTKITVAPYNVSGRGLTTINNEIYLFGTWYITIKTSYKYNPATNIFTQLADSVQTTTNSTTVNNEAYLFSNNSAYVHKYNPTTNTYTKLTNSPMGQRRWYCNNGKK